MKRNTKRAVLLALSIAPVIVLTACGASGSGVSKSMAPSSSVAASSGSHNQADVSFASDMIPHHGQAIEMAAMALQISKNPDVLKLATAIKAAQDPEIRTMSAWLKGWDQPVPSSSIGAMSGMDMKGMMSDADMSNLGKATGAEFDRMWLTMMTTHHKGAIDTANTELDNGKSPAATALAKAIVAGQSAEVTTMTELLSSM